MPNSVSVCRLVLVELVLFVLANKEPELEQSGQQLGEYCKRVLLSRVPEENQVLVLTEQGFG